MFGIVELDSLVVRLGEIPVLGVLSWGSRCRVQDGTVPEIFGVIAMFEGM